MKKVLSALLATALLSPLAANADTIQIQVSGLNLVYDEANAVICDATSCDGPNLDSTESDPLIELVILSNGSEVFATAAAFADILVNLDASADPFALGITGVIGGFFDLFWDGASQGIATDISSGSVIFSNNSINLNGAGFSSIFAQALPGIVAMDPVNWSFSQGLGSCSGDAGSQICTYSGTGELSFESVSVPAPATLALLGLGLAGIGMARRRRTA